MDCKSTISSKGQVVIPKAIRDEMGLHEGSQLMFHLRHDKVVEILTIHADIQEFFGQGAQAKSSKSPVDVDTAISQSIAEDLERQERPRKK